MGEWPDRTTIRFLHEFLRPRSGRVREREVLFEVDGSRRSATVYAPPDAAGRLPGWILLHGVTVPGRHHEALRRMARALAVSGQVAFVPEVPSWTALEVRPADAGSTVRAALDSAGDLAPIDTARLGLMGFSVAATWALEVAGGALAGRFRAVAGMAGYGDIERTIRAMVVGEHEWGRRKFTYAPDPYGRWIMGANLLPLLEGDEWGTSEERAAAATALLNLAQTAGRNGALAREPVYDSLIGELRAEVRGAAIEAWDLLAPPSSNPVPDRAAGRALAGALAGAAVRAYPEMDPSGQLEGLAGPVILLHGRHDTLVPFSETLRLARLLPSAARPHVTITRLFGHTKSRETGRLANPLLLARETLAFVGVVEAMLHALDRPL